MLHARLGEWLFGASLLCVGLIAIYKASALPFGSLSEPDTGLFPVSISILLVLFAALSLGARHLPGGTIAAERAGMARVLVLIVALGAYAWLLPRAGFLVCTVVLLALVLRGLGRVGWVGTGVSALAGAAGCYFLFTRLGLPLPAGVFGF
jgi:hypothetical protein